MEILWQQQNVLTAMFGQLGWEKQEVGTNRIEGGGPISFGQTQSFEPMDDVGLGILEIDTVALWFG